MKKNKHKTILIKLVIPILSLMIMILLFTTLYISIAEKNSQLSYIAICGKEVVVRAIDAPVIVTVSPKKESDTYSIDNKTYKMFCQYSRDYKGYNRFLASHGCMATAMTTILKTYVSECASWTPYETITIAERKVAGESLYTDNYSKKFADQRPMSYYGACKVLDEYGISYEYVQKFSSNKDVKEDLIDHLQKGKPALFVISRYNRETKKYTSKWTSSYHAMIMIGVDKDNNVLIGNPAGSQRFQLVALDEMINYMWSCTKDPNSFYWNGKSKCGGYIKIME